MMPYVLSKPSHNVIFRLFLLRRGKDLLPFRIFDQFACQKERGEIRCARGLLNGMRHKNHRVFFFQLQQCGFHFAS